LEDLQEGWRREKNGGRLFRRPKLTLSCSTEGKEGRKWWALLFHKNRTCQVAIILWHIDLLIGNDRKTNDETTTAMQQLHKHAKVPEPLLGSGPCTTMELLFEVVFSMWSTLRLYHSTDRVQFTDWVQCSWVQWSEVSWLVRSQSEDYCNSVIVSCHCDEKLAATAWG
jgi:hypothetical protein